MQTIKGLAKHDHTLTDIIKTFIFFIVLTAPFIAIMVECLYIICNKNAPSNYTGTPQDVFYNAVNNMTTQTLFSWTTGTAIYTAINSMCTGLSIQGGALPILITYWALMIAIYIVFDIIIKLFTTLTHMFRV